MKKLLITAAIATLSLNAAHAYQVELNGSAGYDRTELSDGKIKTGSVGADATYYFKPVQAKSGPLAEAAFIERASNVSAGYTYSKNDITIDTPFGSFDGDTKVHNFSLGGEIYVPNTDFYASANINRPKIEGSSSKVGAYGVEVGYLPISNLLIAVGVAGTYNHNDGDDNSTDATIRAKYLTKLVDNDFNLEGNVRFGDHSDSYGILGDYYLDRTLSVGLSYDLQTQDHADDTYAVGINARKFIAQNISLQAGINAGEVVGQDNIGFKVGGTYRF